MAERFIYVTVGFWIDEDHPKANSDAWSWYDLLYYGMQNDIQGQIIYPPRDYYDVMNAEGEYPWKTREKEE